MKIGVSGDVGSFSEEAGETYLKKNNIKGEIKHLISVEKVLNEVEGGEIDLGVFPIENSNGGVVFEAINAMGNHLFHIKEYFDIEVNHSLIAKEGVKREDITKIASHDQAFRQCRAYLKQKWPNADLIDRPDTAGAAKALSDGELSKDTAVIAAARCAKTYPGLEVLEDKIQDLKYNYTTFLAVGKKNGREDREEGVRIEDLDPHAKH